MPLTTGERLGPYEILERIGAGGMGEVYRARDTRLNRHVAIKISAAQFTERFEREARAVAALNHPNICTLHDVGPNYLVMEFVEGENLAGPLPIDTAINYAKQIVDAIEAAHDKGIIHRDLKPGNIRVTPEGQVKVLDFGLAKAIEESPISRDQDSPTLSMAATRAGVILGTAAYMPPEQAKGKSADRRADIWSFGVVFYEILTGERPFRGENPSEIMASVIKDEPRMDAVPASLRPLISRCLTKEPRQRFQAIGEARIALERGGTEVVRPVRPSTRLPWAIAGVAIVAASLVSFFHFREAAPEQRVVRFDVRAPEKNVSAMFRLSPDGRYIAFGGADDGATGRMWVRALDAVQAQSIPGTEGARYPFWSPDNASIGFFAQGKLKRVAVTGGPVQTICDAANGRGGTWNRDGVIVFSPGPNSGVYRVQAAGGVATPVSKNFDAEASYRFPEFLPDGRHFLLTVTSNKPDNAGIYLGSLDETPRVRLRPEPSSAFYAPPVAGGKNGLLLFRKEDKLMAQAFDAESLKTTGEMFAVAQEVGESGNSGFGAFAVSDTGILAHAAGQGSAPQELAWVDRKGKRAETVTKPGPIADFSLAPDEKRAVLALFNGNAGDFWLQDLMRQTLTRFSFGSREFTSAIWSPDGARLVYGAAPGSSFSFDLYQKTVGGGKEEFLAHAGVNARPTDWSRDGKSIVYVALGQTTNYDLWVVSTDASAKPSVYLQTPFNERAARFSPDGRYLAYESDESGQDEVYVQPVPPNGAKWQVSNAGGRQPMWRADGKEMYFISGPKLMAVPVKTDASGFQAGTAEPLFDGPRPQDFASVYEPSANGQRFLIRFASGDSDSAAPVTVVLNWQSGVKK